MRQQEQQQRERCCPLSHGASQSAHAAICRDMLPCVLDSDMHVLSCASLGAVLQRSARNQEPHLREAHHSEGCPNPSMPVGGLDLGVGVVLDDDAGGVRDEKRLD